MSCFLRLTVTCTFVSLIIIDNDTNVTEKKPEANSYTGNGHESIAYF